jgi:ACS family tartrate transporter-like MFS transporter
MPLLVWLYLIAYLDRNNVGFAKLDMSTDIGLNATAFGLGAGIFFIGYGIFEISSNAAMHRFGPRKWIAWILVTWGFSRPPWRWRRARRPSTSWASSWPRPKRASSPP